MKTLIMTAVVLAGLTSTVHAQSVRGTVQDHFKTVSNSVPKTERICTDIEVPIYGQGPASTGDALAGAIIGGAIGNQFGNGSGKDAMTVLGAIIGADAANKRGGQQRIIGYTTETRCENQTVYINTDQRVYSHSTITFIDNGKTYTVRFQR